ncbi:MAG: hypothetical protein IJM74_09155 [Bacteroidales bacterium]|nr:hypothetical protein [Bacteroidales bacterium]MBR0194693.1 hypothetical protein [Paludibacteraceae bacterium]
MQIDYRKLVILLLPTFLRQPVLMAWLRAMAYPLQQLHDRHQAARTQRLYELRHTSQICFIKDALNNEFGITDYANGFEIEDINAPGEWVWIYDENVDRFDDEQHMLFDDPTFIHNISAILPPTSAFFVLVPQSITIDETNEARIRSIVNKYRLASRTFEIKTRI